MLYHDEISRNFKIALFVRFGCGLRDLGESEIDGQWYDVNLSDYDGYRGLISINIPQDEGEMGGSSPTSFWLSCLI